MEALVSWMGIIIGLTSLGLYLWHRRYPGRLTFFRAPPVSLVHDVVGRLDRLGVTLDGVPVAKNLVLVRGVIANTGTIDLEPSMISSPLRIELAKPGRFADFEASPGPGVSCSALSVNEGAFEVLHSLLRKGEFIRIEALIELQDDCIDGLLNFSHRISRFDKVRSRLLEGVNSSRKKLIKKMVAASLLIVMMLVVPGAYLLGYLPSPSVDTLVQSRDGKAFFELTPLDDDSIRVRPEAGSSRLLRIRDAEALTGLTFKSNSRFGRWSPIVDAAFILAYPILALWFFYQEIFGLILAHRARKRFGKALEM